MNEDRKFENESAANMEAAPVVLNEENTETVDIPEIPAQEKPKKGFPFLPVSLGLSIAALICMIVIAALGAVKWLYILPAAIGIGAWVLAFLSKKNTMIAMSAVTLAICSVVASGTLLANSSSRSMKGMSMSSNGDDMMEFGRGNGDFSPFDSENGMEDFGMFGGDMSGEDSSSDSEEENPFGSFGNGKGDSSSRPSRNSEDTQSGATEEAEGETSNAETSDESLYNKDFSLKYSDKKDSSTEDID